MQQIPAPPAATRSRTAVLRFRGLLDYDYLNDHLGSAMSAYSIAQAKAHLSALLAQVARGEPVTLTKRGKPVARIVPAGELSPKPKLDLAALKKFRASLPRSSLSSAVMVGKMRDEADGW